MSPTQVVSMLMRVMLAPISRCGQSSVSGSIDPELRRQTLELMRLAIDEEARKSTDHAERVELRDPATDQDVVRVSVWLRDQLDENH